MESLVQKQSDDFAAMATFIHECTSAIVLEFQALSLLKQIIAGPEMICDLWRTGKRVGVALFIDTAMTQGNAAELLIALPKIDFEVLNYSLKWGEEKLASSIRDNLDVLQWNTSRLPIEWAEENGFRVWYSMHKMKRPAVPLPKKVEPPEGLNWLPYEERFLSSYYETTKLAFAPVPGAYVPDLERFGTRARSFAIPAELLVQGDDVVGFVRNEKMHETVIEISTLGRNPSRKGQGLGPIVLARGIEKALELKPAEIRLEVAANNEKAILLYKSFGFVTDSSLHVFRKAKR